MQPLDACSDKRGDQVFRNTADSEAAQHDRRAFEDVGHRGVGTGESLVDHCLFSINDRVASMFLNRVSSLAKFAPDKMGKNTLVQGESLFAGLNSFEPGQE